MTIVVCDGHKVAVDSGGSNGDVVHRIRKWELLHNDSTLVVRIGNSMISGAMLDWYKGEADFPSGAKLADGIAELIVFIITHDLSIKALRFSTSTKPDMMRGSCAFGSGRDFAYGSLFHSRQDAVIAAEAACHYSPHCAKPLDVFTPTKYYTFAHEVIT